jgi:hypothetical protein
VAARGAHRFIGERRKGNSEVDGVTQTIASGLPFLK